MGGSSKQVIGYQYFSFFLLFIGNPIEKVLGINFDKRGWHAPLIDEMGNPLSVGVIEKATLYGENEGGVAGQIHARYGTDNQEVVSFYKDYMDSKELPASAYPFQSYLAFPDFYVGNSGYMKEMLLWPKRIHVRNDGRAQWYDAKAEIPERIKTEGGGGAGEIKLSTRWKRVEGDGTEIELAIHDGATNLSATFTDRATPAGSHPELHAHYNFENPVTGVLKLKYSIGAQAEFRITTNQGIINRIESGGFMTAEIVLTNTKSVKFFTQYTAPNVERWGCLIDALPHVENSKWLYSDVGDINPIHKIREILTDDIAMNKPEISVNDVNFMKAADRVYDEGLGVSWSITEKSCIDAINELCYHIESGIRVNRQTGLYEMVLFRDDWFGEDEIHTISESKIKSMQYEITNADEVINQVNVNYYDRANIKNSSFSISENGLIQTLGRVNAETLDFPYFMNMRNAEIVANCKLKQLSTGAFKGSFTTGWREVRKWNRYDLIRLPWSKRWTGTILVRIMSINLGGPINNEVIIEFIEVVPATGMMNTTIVADDQINTQPEAPKPCNAKVFELPYFEAVQTLGEREVGAELAENPEAGYLCTIAEKPQNNSLSAALHIDSGNGFERVATVNYCETAYLDQAIDRVGSTFIIKNIGNIASVRTGSQIFINNEIMVYQSYEVETKALTVKRGALDSVPQSHDTNSILYFADDFVAIDQTLYVDGEIVDAKVLTTTPSGVLALSDAISHEVEFNARAIRPYPPANVKINENYFPETHVISNEIVLTWVHRNRAQQTGGNILGWFEESVTIEAGVTYSLELSTVQEGVIFTASNINSNTYTISAAALQQNKAHKLRIWSVREGFDSYRVFEHNFFVEAASLILTATTSKNKVTGSTVPTANISVHVDESLNANMKFDGTSISGKASAGSTITIEIEE